MSKMSRLTGAMSSKKTPQSKPIPGSGQIENSAGGHAWKVDRWTRLQRFLILGSEGGSYYAAERDLTDENALTVLECVNEDGPRTVRFVVEVSQGQRAPKNLQAIYALAICCKMGDQRTATEAYRALPKVCRIGTHLFQWADAVKAFGGFSSGTQRAIARWYVRPTSEAEVAKGEPEDGSRHARWLAMQVVKYQRREGWSHRDLLRLAKPGTKGRSGRPVDRDQRDQELERVLDWATRGWDHIYERPPGDATDVIWAFESAKLLAEYEPGFGRSAIREAELEVAKLIRDHGLPREGVPTSMLNSVPVWKALLDNGGRGMPMTALVRNLGKMSSLGLLEPMSASTSRVAAMLTNRDLLHKAGVHPLALLVAMKTYAQGHGVRGSLKWTPEHQIVDALDRAFHLSFNSVQPTNKRWLLALDVSGSMAASEISGMPGISPRVGAAAMAMVTAKVEPRYHVVAFSSGHAFRGGHWEAREGHWEAPSGPVGRARWTATDGLTPLSLSRHQRLDDVIDKIDKMSPGGTDCALPMVYALERKLKVDVFVIYTDSETWAGPIHPAQALQEYRRKMGIDAKLIVVGMVSNGFSIADPEDSGMLDVVGFDTATPGLMAEFAMGTI